MERIGVFIQAIRAGRFDLLPSGDCPGYCPFKRICQFSKARAQAKAPAEADEEAAP
jgi:hypothetical protein